MKKKILLLIACLLLFRSCMQIRDESKDMGTVDVGSEFYFDVIVPETSRSINAAQIDISFDKSRFSVTRIEKNSTFFKYMLEDTYDNNLGWIRVSGGLPWPGNMQKNLRLARVFFSTKKTGNGWVEYSPTSTVLANDGLANEVFRPRGKYWWKIVETK